MFKSFFIIQNHLQIRWQNDSVSKLAFCIMFKQDIFVPYEGAML